MKQVDIIIVGGGMVGLSLAVGLRDSGHSVHIIDAGSGRFEAAKPAIDQPGFFSSGWSPRVSSLNPGSQAYLARLGAWNRLTEERLGPYRRIEVWDTQGTADITFTQPGNGNLGYIVENNLLIDGLESLILEDERVILSRGQQIVSIQTRDSDCLVLLSDDTEISARLLVGADGANSSVRDMAGIGTVDWSYNQRALVSTVLLEDSHECVARQCFTPAGPLAFLPLADQHLCSIVWSVDPDYCHRLEKMDCAGFCAELSRVSEYQLGEIRSIDHRYSFALHQRHARRYRQARLVLIGDAAHSIHPLAGQGVNLGLMDARALAEILQNTGLDSAELRSGLGRFERKRLLANLSMMAAMEGFRFLYGHESPALNWIRNTGMRMVNGSELFKKLIVRYASGELF